MRPSTSLVKKPSGYGTRRSTTVPCTNASSDAPPLPEEMRTECTSVHGCQSTVFLTARQKPGTADVVEFLADSDAELVGGLVGLLEDLFSGRRAKVVLACCGVASF